MSIVEVKVPQLSESVAEATLLQWKKKPGDAVAMDEILIEVETDKVVLEVPAPAAGVMAEIVRGDGSTVVAGELIARLDTEGKGSAASSAPAAQSAAKPTAAAAAPTPAPGGAAMSGVAMPAAAKMMADKGIAAAQVTGTGRDGRITKGDVIAAAEGGAPRAPAPAAASAPAPAARPALPEVKAPIDLSELANRPEQRVPMSRLRQRVAERLVQSQSTAAILTTFNEVNMAPLMDLRNKYKDRFEKEHGVKLGFMSFFVKAAVAALKRYPVVNASIDGNDIVYHGYFDFGKRAGEGKLGLEELTGGTFSISNGGVFGSMLSTPIINPPQSAILGIHATKDRPVVENGQIVIRPMNYLALSYDHRIIDGREAVLSLVAMKEALEDPARLLLEV
jgi:2-oxoglutarate dehydrogenase E2 component (dihydrolipoamide succinyltransferase)